MTTRFFGAPVKRNEDRKLLTGQALFIDDVELPDMLHAAFLRSQVAHARIRSVDVSRALKRPGVVAVYTAGDLGAYWQPGPLLVPPPPIPGTVFNQRTQVPLAREKVRHVGEPLAVVIAESRYIAEDALDDIERGSRNSAGGGRYRSRRLVPTHRMFTTISAPTFRRMCGRPRVIIAARPPGPI